FWFPEAQFAALNGVIRTKVGFAGGKTLNPTYYNLGDHTETIQIEYDPNVISYEELLTKFWTSHNPTSKRSNQYMSAIFYHDAKQEAAAKRSMADRQKHVYRKIVTVIQPAGKFFLAENYHQKYLFRQNRDLSKLLKLSDQDIISSPLVAKLN
ncbi:uncharacterized protein TRIADDRAFT_6339, partial [Trichoplax adhaerens]